MSDSAKARILVIEDDPSILLGLRLNLQKNGYEVGIAEDGLSGMEKLRAEPWSLLILDVMLPRLNGYEVLGRLRDEDIDVPVLMLSARTNEEDKVMGLDLGAEDYITKPFGVPELLARVRAALRRRARARIWRFGDVTVNKKTRDVRKAGEPVELTATQFDVLLTLAEADGGALSRQHIFEAVWGTEHHGTHRTIDNFVGQLRTKLEADPTDPTHLLTVRGVGYRLAP